MALRPKVARERSRARARAPSYGQPRPGLAASPLTVAREEIACGAGVCPLGAARPGSIGTLRALTASHRNVPIETLDALALGPERRAQLAEALANAGLECLLLMTCNRSEIYWHSRDSRDLALIESAWREVTDCADPMFDRLVGREAARHLFRVGSGLESMVLGEPEVLGQLRETLDEPGARARAGTLIAGLVTAAIRCGGRARAETAIGEGALSIASLAARRLLAESKNPADLRVVVLGAGATGRTAARHLKAEGVKHLVIVNRTASRAREVARNLGCEWAPLDSLAEQLAASDAVVASVAASAPLLDPTSVGAAARRRSRPLAIVDLSMPRAAEPALRHMKGVRLWDLSDLERVASENHARRDGEVPRVEALIERELKAFTQWAKQQSLRPMVNAMRERAERICRTELERALASGPLDPERLEAATQRLVDLMVAAHADVLQSEADGSAA